MVITTGPRRSSARASPDRSRTDRGAWACAPLLGGECAQRGPGRPVSECAQNPDGGPTAVRKLVPHVPAPSRDHREDEATAFLEQNLVDPWIVHADLVRYVSDVKLDGAKAARLEVDEDQAVCGVEEVPGMRLSVQELVHVHVSAD